MVTDSNYTPHKPRIRPIVTFLFAFALAAAVCGISEQRASIIQIRCVGCGDCVKVCTRNAVAIVRGKAVIDPEKCNGCGLCLSICSYHALRIRHKGEQ